MDVELLRQDVREGRVKLEQLIALIVTPQGFPLAYEVLPGNTIDNSTLDAAGIKDAAKAFAVTFDDRADRGGVDLIYDPVGGEVGEVALRALGEDGQYLVIGFVAGIPKLAANQVLLRNRRVTGVDWGAWVGRHQDENRALLAEVGQDLINQSRHRGVEFRDIAQRRNIIQEPKGCPKIA